jgi:hypothetical protein
VQRFPISKPIDNTSHSLEKLNQLTIALLNFLVAFCGTMYRGEQNSPFHSKIPRLWEALRLCTIRQSFWYVTINSMFFLFLFL